MNFIIKVAIILLALGIVSAIIYGLIYYFIWNNHTDDEPIENYEIINKTISENYYTKDNKVYFITKTLTTKNPYLIQELKNIDIKEFKPLSTNIGVSKETGIYRNIPIKGTDPETFKAINEEYSKDKNNVYFRTQRINEADPETFKVLGKGYSKDKNNIYLIDKIVTEENPETFNIN